ncbi:HutD family protein [Shewanella sp. SR44-3]|uniref:HutD/Ves family protein n=1 Tax=Shewanella sp. SR44-3 TaxID=2760936 RepID=UPI0015FC295A|nr:HutD family protein [Shewanella sp. SR44-3]MBB1270930.1 HutD family protein [Shewanella sp. SR44-3]
MRIISPNEFKRLPWKNGKGETIELAINDGGTMADFDWRISMAKVTEDGPFSDFSGYQRHLLLLDGIGITLKHQHAAADDHGERQTLATPLAIAEFDGGLMTSGTLMNGPISDFNLIVNAAKYRAEVHALQANSLTLPLSQLLFAYAVTGNGEVTLSNNTITLPQGHLLRLAADELAPNTSVNFSGERVIIMSLTLL